MSNKIYYFFIRSAFEVGAPRNRKAISEDALQASSRRISFGDGAAAPPAQTKIPMQQIVALLFLYFKL